MRWTVFFWVLLFSLSIPYLLFSQANTPNKPDTENDFGKTLDYLQDKSLEVLIHARIKGRDQENIWTTKVSEVTVSGKSVSITLEGADLKIVALLIPFLNEDNSIFLIAKGEVWIQEGPGEERKYYSTVKSLPIDAGESVIFFPTGMIMDSEDESIFTIELEMQVEVLG